jgi:hypothetical protein
MKRFSWIFLLPAISGCAGAPVAERGLPPSGVELIIIEGAALPKVQESPSAGFTGLTHLRTDVKARITTYVATVAVTQQYVNPHDRPVDAEYSFPLPDDAGVRDFVLQIGERKIRGIIREREEARRIYREARRQGFVTTLLARDPSNRFTQSVSNIGPGRKVDLQITYLHGLRYSAGLFEFVFPRVGTELALEAVIDGEVADVTSSHPIRVEGSKVTLTAPCDGEFILRYRVPARALFAVSEGYFVLLVQPPVADLRIDWGGLQASEVYPREIPTQEPVILTGRCGRSPANVRLTGRSFDLTVAAREVPANGTLATVWARAKLSSLASREEITAHALRYNLISDWTSFVTVDAMEKKK